MVVYSFSVNSQDFGTSVRTSCMWICWQKCTVFDWILLGKPSEAVWTELCKLWLDHPSPNCWPVFLATCGMNYSFLFLPPELYLCWLHRLVSLLHQVKTSERSPACKSTKDLEFLHPGVLTLKVYTLTAFSSCYLIRGRTNFKFKWLEESVVTQMKLPSLRSFSTFFFANGAETFVIIALVFVYECVVGWKEF